MNKMAWRKSSAVLSALLIVIFSFGCSFMNKSYAGRYWIGRTSPSFITNPASKEINDKIEEVVRGVAKDYGFGQLKRSSWEDPNVISFSKRNYLKTPYNSLKGSDAAIAIVITKGPKPEVGIKDYTHNYETEFMKALKADLVKRLSNVVDMNGVEFIRHWGLE
ncbi:MAG TPA: hypothetical protein VMU10_06730 [Desulfomonilia bacterium]|nr:hypothetical protein [Desulfomonilia bacterium]